MKLSKPLVHLRLSQCCFYYWDPKDDPREPEYWESRGGGGSFFNALTNRFT